MGEENINQELHLGKINEIRNYFIKEINQNKLMSKKHKQVFTVSNYLEHLFILASTVTGCVSISAFASLVGIPVGIASSAVGIKNFAMAARIKKYKSTLEKRRRNMIN